MKRPESNGNFATKRVDLGDGDWCIVRTRMTAGDTAAIQRAAMRMKVNMTQQSVEGMEFDTVSGNIACIARMVLQWGGPHLCVIDHDAQGTEHHEGTPPCLPEKIIEDYISTWETSDMDRIVRAINEAVSITQPRAVNPVLVTMEGGTPNP